MTDSPAMLIPIKGVPSLLLSLAAYDLTVFNEVVLIYSAEYRVEARVRKIYPDMNWV